MALPKSSISQVCRSVADFLSQELKASQNYIRVMIGIPSDAVPGQSDTEHRLNLFFFRFEPAGFGPDILPDEPWLIRLHCLVTAFGVVDDHVSAGENDLRLLGEVIRIFHENPVMVVGNVDGEQVQLQVVFQSLSMNDINHLWSTQGDVKYHSSVFYEMALAPVVPRQRGVGEPLVGAIGSEVHARMSARFEPFTGSVRYPPVMAMTVNTIMEDWAPQICLVRNDTCVQSLAFAVGCAELDAFTLGVWVAGKVGSDVKLQWEVWDSVIGWRNAEPTVDTTCSSLVIDPGEAATAKTFNISLPFTDHAGQAVLYAVRQYTRASDGTKLKVRSNPVLISLYEEVI